MSYRSDFYITDNIIGFTGDIEKSPTVYFLRNEPDGTQSFGHITQVWGNPKLDVKGKRFSNVNVGREKVRIANDYVIDNTGHKGHCYERALSINFSHPSRTSIVFVNAATDHATKFKLSKAITEFTEEKQIEKYSEEEFNKLWHTGHI